METHDDMRREVTQTQRILNEVMEGKDRGLVERVSALVTAYKAERERGEILKTKLAMREQQLRDAYAEQTVWRKAYVDTFDWFSHMFRDILGGEYVHGDGASVDDARERGRVLAAEFAERIRTRLREADADVAQLRTDLARMRESMSEDAVDWRDKYNETRVKLDQMIANKARLDQIGDETMRHFMETPVDASPEPWEGIVTAAIRWRNGMDRGELAREVDIFRGTHEWNRCADPTCSGRGIRTTCRTCAVCRGRVVNTLDAPFMTSDLKGLAARESIVEQGRPVYQDGVLAGHVVPMDTTGVCVLRPEQYADGAGAQAWRQAMGGRL